MRAVAPVPFRADWAPSYLGGRPGALNRDMVFRFEDSQGMPADSGRKYHAAWDIFCPKGTRVLAALDGKIVESWDSGDRTGQVYGGVVKILNPGTGRVFVYRHIANPTRTVGSMVRPGEQVAEVSPWEGPGSGWPHLHLEVWRTLAGGYDFENAIDPSSIEWSESIPATAQEETPTPPPGDGSLRFFLRPAGRRVGTLYSGWDKCIPVFRWILENHLDPRCAATVAYRKSKWSYDGVNDPGWITVRFPDGRIYRRRGTQRKIENVIEHLMNFV